MDSRLEGSPMMYVLAGLDQYDRLQDRVDVAWLFECDVFTVLDAAELGGWEA